ncbi:MAG: response regulator [Ktedonobacteraceae bacterium]
MAYTHASLEADKNAKTILVIEDDDSIAEVVAMVIQQETPYQVIRFTDGYAAWTRMQYRRLFPDLLILDYHLPLMTGVEFYDHLHANKEYEHIPALILSAYRKLCNEAAKVRNLACLEKPFALDDLLNMIEQLIA